MVGALKGRRKLPDQSRTKCRGKGEGGMACPIILAKGRYALPSPRQTEETPHAADMWGGALPEHETPVSKLPPLLSGSKASNSHMLSRTTLPAPTCLGSWWEPAVDAASVDAWHGPASPPEAGAGSSRWFWSRGEGGNKRLRGSATAEQSFKGADG